MSASTNNTTCSINQPEADKNRSGRIVAKPVVTNSETVLKGMGCCDAAISIFCVIVVFLCNIHSLQCLSQSVRMSLCHYESTSLQEPQIIFLIILWSI